MIASNLFQSATDNMISTYVAIAEGSPNCEVHRGKSWTGCRSSLKHPIANFALVREGGEDAKAEAADFLAGRPYACIYALANDSESNQRQSLMLMAAKASNTESSVEVVLAATDSERRAVADFMVSQFFGSQSKPVREVLVLASAKGRVPLYWLNQLGKRFGAVALNTNDGALGIYNFCVDARQRGRGLGSLALSAMAKMADDIGLDLTLQCSSNLVPFYSKNSYQIVGHVDIWSLERGKSAVIMRGR